MNTEEQYRHSHRPVVSSTAVKGARGIGSIFEPMNLVRMLARRWLLIVLTMILGGVAGVFYSQQMPKLYTAEAQLEMSVRRPRVINNDAVFEETANNEAVIFNTRFAKFKSPAMERLATHEYFQRYPDDDVSSGGRVSKYLLTKLISEVAWFKDYSANIVYVSFTGPDAEFAAKLVNTLSHCAGLLMMQENQAISDEAVKWLISQLEEQREDLEAVEAQLAQIREELKLDSLEQRKKALVQALIVVTGEREGFVSDLASKKTVLEFVMELKDADPNLEMLPTGLPKEEQLNELVRAWQEAREALQLASGRYTELHPEYRKASEKESRAKGRLEQFIEVSGKAVENEIELLSKQLSQVTQRIHEMEAELLNLEQQLVGGQQKLQRLERKREAADNAYQSMLRRMEEARLSADENMAFTKIIRNAEVPGAPENAGRVQIAGTGAFLGVVAGAFLALLMTIIGDRIESVTDLKQLELHILATLPTYKKVDTRSELATLGLRDKFSHMVEIFAGICATLSSNKYIDKTKVLLLNSALPGEGKTVSSCNLAICSALNGTKTLLIDGDLRRPQLGGIFGIDKEHPSLLDWLVDEDRYRHEELVSKDVVENLDIISSRPLQNINPAEMLGSSQLADLIAWGRENYDRVIIDSPPLGAVGDGQVLANLADSVIIVSRIGKTKRRTLLFALAKLSDIDAEVVGCIANDVPHSLGGMFQGAEGYGYIGYGGYKPYGKD